MNRRPWQRMLLSLIGILIVHGIWMGTLTHLYHLPPASLAAFTTITVNSQYVIGAIVIFMVTGRLIYEWRNSTVSQIIETGEQIREEIIERRTPAPKQFDTEEIP